MPPPAQASARSGSFRDRFSNKKTSKNQSYMPVHESIPEEDDPRYRDDDREDDMANLLASSDSEPDSDPNAVKLRRRSSSKSKAKAPATNHAAAYVPVVRNSGDIESYLDSITEAEQELLSASRYDYEDGDEGYDDYELGVADSDSDTDAYASKMKRRKMMDKQKYRRVSGGGVDGRPVGWRAYWYSKTWCRALVVVVLCLVLLVLGFLSFAKYRKRSPPYYVSCVCRIVDSPVYLCGLLTDVICLAYGACRSPVSYAARRNYQVLGG